VTACFEGTLVAWFGEIDRTHTAAAGGKGASLSDMASAGMPVPPGFVICTESFRQFLQSSGLDQKILTALVDLDVEDNARLEHTAQEITGWIQNQACPEQLQRPIAEAYQRMCAEYGGTAVVAVRSSAAAEDSSAASFAGQQETYLNIFGEKPVIEKVRACWGSFFHSRAIFYRKLRGSLSDTNIAVVVQRMVNPDKAGVMFTVDPVQRRRDRVMIEAAWGLGESVVSGLVTPDNYVINKADGRLVSKFIARKPVAIVREERGVGCRQINLPPEKVQAQVLSNDEIARLLALGKQIEEHFGSPQDVEWAFEGESLYVLQSRPVTTL
jgi:pyruvate,water dikinase